MTTTLQAHGGGAQPASIDTSGKVAGGAAQRVYGFDSAEAALAAGYVCEGGPAMSVALITDAQIAAGEWKAEGDPAALAVYTAPDGMPVEGGYAVPVYPVNGWGSAPAPSDPIGDALRADCVAYWKMDESSGTRVDATGHGNDASIIVSVSSVMGVVNNAVQFTPNIVESEASYLGIPAPNSNLTIGYQDFFVWGWFLLHSLLPLTSSEFWALFDRNYGAVGQPELSIGVTLSFGVETLEIIYGGSYPAIYASTVDEGDLLIETKYFFVAGYDKSLNKCFIRLNNGTLHYGDVPDGTPIFPADQNIESHFGGYPSYSPSTLDGWIDEIGIVYGRLPSQDDQDYLYNSGAGRTLYP